MFAADRKPLLLSLLLVGGCHWPGDGRVEIRNDTKVEASDIVVETGGLRLDADPMAAGETQALWFSAVQDSGLQMRFRLGNEPHPRECSGDVYVTGSGSERLFVTILPDGSCIVETQFDRER
jgi:hypothetical protein